MAVGTTDGTLLMPIKVDPLIGALFAEKYRITEEIGRGGMSIVYRGVHELMKRPVAVKIMQRELSSNAVSVRRFQQEAEAASRLAHPHVITVFDFGVTPTAQPYLVMDLVSGTNFAEILKESGRIPVPRVIKIFRQICDALDHAHQRGVVHRDLKPSNVMLVDTESEPDYAKVLDFGIAKVMASDGEEKRSLTTSGEIFGSPLYMSPEQCRGAESDQRTDIYSVGVMFYEALTGRPPLCGASYIETIQMQISTPAQPFNTVVPGANIPPVLETIAFKAIAKKPEDRFQSMREFNSALLNAARMLGLEEADQNAPAQVVKRKSPFFMGAIVVALVGLCAFFFLSNNGSAPPRAGASETVSGTVYYYNPDAVPGILVINYGDGAYKILTGNARLEHVASAPHEPIVNGSNWTVAFHRMDKKLYLDEKGTVYDNAFDKDIRQVDQLVRNHYSNLANGHFEEAWNDFSDQFVQKVKSKDEMFERWKGWKGVKDCENAPDSAIQILLVSPNTVSARIDASNFVQYEKSDYLITFWKQGKSWKFQSLTLEPKETAATGMSPAGEPPGASGAPQGDNPKRPEQ